MMHRQAKNLISHLVAKGQVFFASRWQTAIGGKVKQNMLNAEVAKLTMLKDIDTWQLKKIIEDIAPMIGLKVTDIKSTKES